MLHIKYNVNIFWSCIIVCGHIFCNVKTCFNGKSAIRDDGVAYELVTRGRFWHVSCPCSWVELCHVSSSVPAVSRLSSGRPWR